MPTMTITTTTDQANRIAAAIGAKLGLEGPANAAQIKADVIQHIKATVHSYETQQAAIAAADAVQQMPDPS